MSYVNYWKLAQVTKKRAFRACCASLDIKCNTAATLNYLLTLHRLRTFYLRHYKGNIFGDNTDDVIDDVITSLVPRVMQ